jgi:tryptophan synthase alpha chain
MVSQITSEARLEKMAKLCSGYVYLVSRLGTTGTREKLNSNLKKLIEKTKRYFNIPIYVGFGISKPEHVQKVFTIGANGVIIGSAISRIIEENHANKIKMIENLSNFLSSLKT